MIKTLYDDIICLKESYPCEKYDLLSNKQKAIFIKLFIESDYWAKQNCFDYIKDHIIITINDEIAMNIDISHALVIELQNFSPKMRNIWLNKALELKSMSWLKRIIKQIGSDWNKEIIERVISNKWYELLKINHLKLVDDNTKRIIFKRSILYGNHKTINKLLESNMIHPFLNSFDMDEFYNMDWRNSIMYGFRFKYFVNYFCVYKLKMREDFVCGTIEYLEDICNHSTDLFNERIVTILEIIHNQTYFFRMVKKIFEKFPELYIHLKDKHNNVAELYSTFEYVIKDNPIIVTNEELIDRIKEILCTCYSVSYFSKDNKSLCFDHIHDKLHFGISLNFLSQEEFMNTNYICNKETFKYFPKNIKSMTHQLLLITNRFSNDIKYIFPKPIFFIILNKCLEF